MKIAVMGAGGIGGYVGGRLAEAGEEVYFIARGAHLEAIRTSGLRIESAHGDVHLTDARATEDPVDVGRVDLVLFTVRLADTDQAAAALVPMMTPSTHVITLQNGIDSADMISRYAPRRQIAAGIIYIAGYIASPGVITNPGGAHHMTIDALNGDEMMAAFFAACDRATGNEASPTNEAEKVVWQKFIALAASSGITSITRLPIGAVYEHADAVAFMGQLLDENIAVAKASGQDFAPAMADRIIEFFRNQPYEQESSMLVDIENGKPLELPWLSGRVRQLGLELGVATPANAAVWAALCPYVAGRR